MLQEFRDSHQCMNRHVVASRRRHWTPASQTSSDRHMPTCRILLGGGEDWCKVLTFPGSLTLTEGQCPTRGVCKC